VLTRHGFVMVGLLFCGWFACDGDGGAALGVPMSVHANHLAGRFTIN
jgi:hypothetical protein